MAKKKPRRTLKKVGKQKDGTMKVGTIRKASEIGSKSRRRGSKYDPILDQMRKLKRNEGFVIEVPRGLSAEALMNRLNVTIHRQTDLVPPAGCEFLKRTTDDGNIAIMCLPIEAE